MEQTHSGLGIASFSLSLIMLVLTFALVLVAGFMEATSEGGLDENSGSSVLLGLGILGCAFFNLVAAGLGIGGLFQRDKKKLFAILGIVFSIVTVLCVGGLIAIGMAMP